MATPEIFFKNPAKTRLIQFSTMSFQLIYWFFYLFFFCAQKWSFCYCLVIYYQIVDFRFYGCIEGWSPKSWGLYFTCSENWLNHGNTPGKPEKYPWKSPWNTLENKIWNWVATLIRDGVPKSLFSWFVINNERSNWEDQVKALDCLLSSALELHPWSIERCSSLSYQIILRRRNYAEQWNKGKYRMTKYSCQLVSSRILEYGGKSASAACM